MYEEVIEILERRAMCCDEIATKEDQKKPNDKVLHKIYAAQIAAAQLRETAAEIRRLVDLGQIKEDANA